jgi:hypothetical protein
VTHLIPRCTTLPTRPTILAQARVRPGTWPWRRKALNSLIFVYCTQPTHAETTMLVCPHHEGAGSPHPAKVATRRKAPKPIQVTRESWWTRAGARSPSRPTRWRTSLLSSISSTAERHPCVIQPPCAAASNTTPSESICLPYILSFVSLISPVNGSESDLPKLR